MDFSGNTIFREIGLCSYHMFKKVHKFENHLFGLRISKVQNVLKNVKKFGKE